MKPILQRSHTITAQSLCSNHIFQANAHRSQADTIEQAVLEIQMITALSPPPPPPHQQQPQHSPAASLQHDLATPPMPIIPLHDQESNVTIHDTPSAHMILSLEGACRSSNRPLSGDLKLYTFFQYTRGNEILLCYCKFELGLSGWQFNGEGAQDWREQAKRVNKMTKTFRSQKRVYVHVKEVAEREKCSVTESAARLQQDMDARSSSYEKQF
ncbi:hypothetical protein BJ741DRAFT_593060 [Chytriomyces cf. hyalinus JEL632]|nr:hypothetical protein BJ741DRAFT_593060 [Chytriomyces cf. hyalinus JEL632]